MSKRLAVLIGWAVLVWGLGAGPAQAGQIMSAQQCAKSYPAADESLKRFEQETGIPRSLVWEVVWAESRCLSDVRGNAGEVGLAQIIPSDQTEWPRWWFADRPATAELMDAVLNVRTAGYILQKNRDVYCREYRTMGARLRCAARVYNGGTAWVVRYGPRPKNGGAARAWLYGDSVVKAAANWYW